MGGTRSSGNTRASAQAGPPEGYRTLDEWRRSDEFWAAPPSPSPALSERLTEADRRNLSTTSQILERGFSPVSSDEADRLSREAADVINSNTRTGYTVYSSRYTGLTKDGADMVYFGGVAYGSGASRSTIARGVSRLASLGYKARIVDDEYFRGIVVSRS